MNELIFADQELEVGFIGKLDALPSKEWAQAKRLRRAMNSF